MTSSNYRPRASGWTIIFVSVAVLGLGGCGRKAGLDLPPNSPPSSVVLGPTDTEADQASKPSVFNPTYGSDAAPAATKGRKKPFVLDPLLKD